tara:strand:+ start:753 stop:1535 length:783 start_codon:yes stop_codon:yes gene_type:complete
MKRIIFSIYTNNIEEHTSTSVFKRSQFEKYKHKLKQRQEEYATICNAQYKLFQATNTNFIDIQFEKLIIFSELSKEYDEVLYIDFDVIPMTNKVFFDSFNLNKISGYKLDKITEVMHKLQRRIEDDGFDRMNMFCKTCCKKAMLLLEDIDSDNYIFNTGVFAGNKKSIKKLNFIKRLKKTRKIFEEALTDNVYPHEINKWWKPNNEVFVSYIIEKFNIPYNNIGLQWNFILDNWNPKPAASGYLLHYIRKEFNLTFDENK